MCKEKNKEFKLLDFDVSYQQDQFEWDIVFSLRFEWWMRKKLDQLRFYGMTLENENHPFAWDEDTLTQAKAMHKNYQSYFWIAWALLVASVIKYKHPSTYDEYRDVLQCLDLSVVQQIKEAIPCETLWKAWYQVIHLMHGDMSVDYVNRNLALQEYAYKYASTREDKTFDKEDLCIRILANTLMQTNRFAWSYIVVRNHEIGVKALDIENFSNYMSAEEMTQDTSFLSQVFDMSQVPCQYFKVVKREAKKAYKKGWTSMYIHQQYDPIDWNMPIGK